MALGRGCKPKWVAKYCGTSLEMLDKHYGRWMDDDQGQLDLLAPQSANPGPGGPKTRTKSRTISRGRRNAAIPRAEGGRFELREDEAQAEPKSRATPQTSKGNETASGSRFNPKTTRKNPT